MSLCNNDKQEFVSSKGLVTMGKSLHFSKLISLPQAYFPPSNLFALPDRQGYLSKDR